MKVIAAFFTLLLVVVIFVTADTAEAVVVLLADEMKVIEKLISVFNFVPVDTCRYCGKRGHYERSCYKKKNDYETKRNTGANTAEASGNRNNATADNGNLAVFLAEGETL